MKNSPINDILERYGKLLGEVDSWFAGCRERFPKEIACQEGCSACCRGLFDITLLDACHLKHGFDRLDASVRERVLAKAEARFVSLKKLWPELAHPFLLNHRSDEEWEALMPEEDETPCVLLGEGGRCLVYEHRPMTCRLNGLPLVDISGAVFMEEWCSENFKAVDPLPIEELRWKFYQHFRQELIIFREFSQALTGKPVNELDTLIPLALLMDFEGFDWRGWEGSR